MELSQVRAAAAASEAEIQSPLRVADQVVRLLCVEANPVCSLNLTHFNYCNVFAAVCPLQMDTRDTNGSAGQQVRSQPEILCTPSDNETPTRSCSSTRAENDLLERVDGWPCQMLRPEGMQMRCRRGTGGDWERQQDLSLHVIDCLSSPLTSAKDHISSFQATGFGEGEAEEDRRHCSEGHTCFRAGGRSADRQAARHRTSEQPTKKTELFSDAAAQIFSTLIITPQNMTMTVRMVFRHSSRASLCSRVRTHRW